MKKIWLEMGWWLLELAMLLSSFSMVIVFYCVAKINLLDATQWWVEFLAKLVLPVAIAMMTALGCERVTAKLKDSDTAKIEDLQPLEAQVLPTYIGMFVISLGIVNIPTSTTLVIFLILLVLWWMFEKVFYYNPFWSLLGYRFYSAKLVGKEKIQITLITKSRDLKGGRDLRGLKRINNYTYMEVCGGR